MKTKRLALHLILEDLQYHQLTTSLRTLYMDPGYAPELAMPVAALMGIKKGKASDQWLDIYADFMAKAGKVDFGNKEELRELAEGCYLGLKEIS